MRESNREWMKGNKVEYFLERELKKTKCVQVHFSENLIENLKMSERACRFPLFPFLLFSTVHWSQEVKCVDGKDLWSFLLTKSSTINYEYAWAKLFNFFFLYSFCGEGKKIGVLVDAFQCFSTFCLLACQRFSNPCRPTTIDGFQINEKKP